VGALRLASVPTNLDWGMRQEMMEPERYDSLKHLYQSGRRVTPKANPLNKFLTLLKFFGIEPNLI
jgi:hypothetical protein